MTDTKALVVISPSENTALDVLRPEIARAEEYLRSAEAKNTRRGYAADWKTFVRWCAERQQSAANARPEAVAAYLAWLADNGRSPPTIERAYSGLAFHLRTANPEVWPLNRRPDVVTRMLRSIRRRIDHTVDAKNPITQPELKQLLEILPGGTLGARDRAVLLLGFLGAFRRSELVGINVADLTFTDEGVTIVIPRSKTDQEGKKQHVSIFNMSSPKLCAVRTLRAWLEVAKIVEGPIFRAISRNGTVLNRRLHSGAVAQIVKRTCTAIGLDATKFAGHSLRAGFVTAAAKDKRDINSIMKQTRQKRFETVQRYIRFASPFENNATEGLLR